MPRVNRLMNLHGRRLMKTRSACGCTHYVVDRDALDRWPASIAAKPTCGRARTLEDLLQVDALLRPGDLLYIRDNGNPRFDGVFAVVRRVPNR
jgi:hypothetical protein